MPCLLYNNRSGCVTIKQKKKKKVVKAENPLILEGSSSNKIVGAWSQTISCGIDSFDYISLSSALPQNYTINPINPKNSVEYEDIDNRYNFFFGGVGNLGNVAGSITGYYRKAQKDSINNPTFKGYFISIGGSGATLQGWTTFINLIWNNDNEITNLLNACKCRNIVGIDWDVEPSGELTLGIVSKIKDISKQIKTINNGFKIMFSILVGQPIMWGPLITEPDSSHYDYLTLMVYNGGMFTDDNIEHNGGCTWKEWAKMYLTNGRSDDYKPKCMGNIKPPQLKNIDPSKIIIGLRFDDAYNFPANREIYIEARKLIDEYDGAGVFFWEIGLGGSDLHDYSRLNKILNNTNDQQYNRPELNNALCKYDSSCPICKCTSKDTCIASYCGITTLETHPESTGTSERESISYIPTNDDCQKLCFEKNPSKYPICTNGACVDSSLYSPFPDDVSCQTKYLKTPYTGIYGNSICSSPIAPPTPAPGPSDGVYVLHKVVKDESCNSIRDKYKVPLNNIFRIKYQNVLQKEIKPILSLDDECGLWPDDILLISTCPVHTVVKGDNCETIQKTYTVPLEQILIARYRGVNQTEIKPITTDQCVNKKGEGLLWIGDILIICGGSSGGTTGNTTCKCYPCGSTAPGFWSSGKCSPSNDGCSAVNGTSSDGCYTTCSADCDCGSTKCSGTDNTPTPATTPAPTPKVDLWKCSFATGNPKCIISTDPDSWMSESKCHDICQDVTPTPAPGPGPATTPTPAPTAPPTPAPTAPTAPPTPAPTAPPTPAPTAPPTTAPPTPAPTPPPTPAPTAPPTPAPTAPTTPAPTAPTGSCSALWGQCGGRNWSGPKCCEESSCIYQGAWYSQCRPDDSSTPAPTTTTPAPTAPTPTPAPTPPHASSCIDYNGDQCNHCLATNNVCYKQSKDWCSLYDNYIWCPE